MTHDDYCGASIAEYSTHLAIEHTTNCSTWLTLDINTFLIECYMSLHICYVVGTKVVHNTIAACNRHG